ncbi:TPA: hypothetical protein DCQ44_03540 [Candidatus Taylorbacteria bacterium]|nr:hypothetical protein [Candidatus Taylorbacteria bacterium]
MSHKNQKEEIKKGIKAIWRHLQPFKKQVYLLIFLGVISAIANGFVPYVTGRFFDTLIGVSNHTTVNGYGYLPLWGFFLLLWTITQLISNNIDWIMDRIKRIVDNDLGFRIQADGFIHLFLLPLSYHKNTHINGDMQKISQAGWRISTIVRSITDIAPQLLSVLIGLVLSASINLTLAAILLIGVILYVTLLVKILLPVAALDSKAHRVWNDSWDDAASSIQQVDSVKQAAAEEYEIQKVRTSIMVNSKNLWAQIELVWSNVSFFQRTIVFLTQLAVFIFSVHFVSTGAITVGQLVALNGYSMMFFGPFVALGHSWQIIQNGIISAAHAEEIFEQKPEIYVPENASRFEKIAGEVKFDNVFFKYGADQPDVLFGIDFEVQPGEVVAMVGESGVGKSTAISLISGYYFPTEGQVLVDGVDTRSMNLKTLRRHIGVVPQEVALFNDTLRVNICYGTFNVTDAELANVAREAHIEKFISNLPEGYNTLVGDRGIKLSVGQKQRVAIARAMLRKPAILILDEPTSALDAQTEKNVTEALEKLMTGRTTFIIAHRLSTVRKANKILVFENGRIVETGTHKQLIAKKGGVYQKLYEYQVGLH